MKTAFFNLKESGFQDDMDGGSSPKASPPIEFFMSYEVSTPEKRFCPRFFFSIEEK